MELQANSAADNSPVQSVQRAAQLLRLVAQNPEGARLNDLVNGTGLKKATAHRLLKQLIASGLLMQDARRHYQLGPGAFELGIAASRAFPLRDLAGPLLEEVAESTGNATILVVRSRADSMCVDRRLGSFPLNVRGVEPGHRRPIGVGAGGLAMLGFLAPDDQQACLEEVGRRLTSGPHGGYGGLTVLRLSELAEETRQRGWACMSHYAAPGITGVAAPLFDSQGHPFGAITVRASALRMTTQKIAESAVLLQKKARKLETILASKSVKTLMLNRLGRPDFPAAEKMRGAGANGM